jgi:argininosuccinate lyase
MPQKRNPVALEHARAIGSKALGQAMAILLSVHNTPFGDIVDTEDDLQPLVFAMFRDAARAAKLVAASLGAAAFDTARLASRAEQGWITITELADTLTRDHAVPFKTSHTIASRLIAEVGRRRGESIAAILREVSADVMGRAIEYDDAALAWVLSAKHFIEVRQTPGGPAPGETARASRASQDVLVADEHWVNERVERLRAAEEALREAVARL